MSAVDRDSLYNLGPDGDPTGADNTLDLENTDLGINTHPEDDHFNSHD